MAQEIDTIPDSYSGHPVLVGALLNGFGRGSSELSSTHQMWIDREVRTCIEKKQDILVYLDSFSSESQELAQGRNAAVSRAIAAINSNCNYKVFATQSPTPLYDEKIYVRIFSGNPFVPSKQPATARTDNFIDGLPNWFVKEINLTGGSKEMPGHLGVKWKLGVGIEAAVGTIKLESLGAGPPFDGEIIYSGVSIGREIALGDLRNSVLAIPGMKSLMKAVESLSIGVAFSLDGRGLDKNKFSGNCIIVSVSSSAVAASSQMYLVFFGITASMTTLLHFCGAALRVAATPFSVGVLHVFHLDSGYESLLQSAAKMCRGCIFITTAGMGFSSAGASGSICVGQISGR